MRLVPISPVLLVLIWTLSSRHSNNLVHAGGDDGGGEFKPTGRYKFEEKENVSVYSRLVEYMKHDYQPLATPICAEGEKLRVNMDMWLYQLFDLEEVTQMLSVDVWMALSWVDCGLRWDPRNFSNVEHITLPAKEIWIPDLINYESLHGNFEEGMYLFGQSIAKIRYDGTVQLGTQGLLKTFCHFHVENFPFDTQVCNITFASWNRDNSIFEIVSHGSSSRSKNPPNTPQHMGHSFADASNGEWSILAFPSYNLVNSYRVGIDEAAERNYSEVRYQLVLQRKPTYVQLYLISPCLILVWIAAITFILPVECGEKIGLAITVMLSLIVFLLLVADNIPRSSDGIPILGRFYVISIALVFLCVLMTTFVLNIGLKSTDMVMPAFMHKILRHRIGALFCFRYSDAHENHKWMSLKMVPLKQKRNQNNLCERNDGGEDERCQPDKAEMVAFHTESNSAGPSATVTVSNTKSNPCLKNDWRFLALLLDRIFFLVYIILATALTLYICLQKPMKFDNHAL